jgi:O-6-methylguanine DNA methyltransferase
VEAVNPIYYSEMESPIGTLVLGATTKGLCQIEFGNMADSQQKLVVWSRRWMQTERWIPDGDKLAPAREQLEQYFRGERKQFELILDLRGTLFQQKVWTALAVIPYGSTASYKDIGQQIGQASAVRAVGGANHCNPIPIIVPCHRVIGADGTMVGYGGGLHIKKHLLGLEGHEVP